MDLSARLPVKRLESEPKTFSLNVSSKGIDFSMKSVQNFSISSLACLAVIFA